MRFVRARADRRPPMVEPVPRPSDRPVRVRLPVRSRTGSRGVWTATQGPQPRSAALPATDRRVDRTTALAGHAPWPDPATTRRLVARPPRRIRRRRPVRASRVMLAARRLGRRPTAASAPTTVSRGDRRMRRARSDVPSPPSEPVRDPALPHPARSVPSRSSKRSAASPEERVRPRRGDGPPSPSQVHARRSDRGPAAQFRAAGCPRPPSPSGSRQAGSLPSARRAWAGPPHRAADRRSRGGTRTLPRAAPARPALRASRFRRIVAGVAHPPWASSGSRDPPPGGRTDFPQGVTRPYPRRQASRSNRKRPARVQKAIRAPERPHRMPCLRRAPSRSRPWLPPPMSREGCTMPPTRPG